MKISMLYSIPTGLNYSQYCKELKCKDYRNYTVPNNYSDYLELTGAKFTCLNDFLDLFDIPDGYDYAKSIEERRIWGTAGMICEIYADNISEDCDINDIPVINPTTVSQKHNHIYPKLPDICNKLGYLSHQITACDNTFINSLVDIMTDEEKMYYQMFWDALWGNNYMIYYHTSTVMGMNTECIDCSNWSKEECTNLLYLNPGGNDHISGFAITPQLFLDILDRFYDGKIPESFGFGWLYSALVTEKWGEGIILEENHFDSDDPELEIIKLLENTIKERYGELWQAFNPTGDNLIHTDTQKYIEELEKLSIFKN